MEHVGLFVLGLVLLAVGVLLAVFGSARLDRGTGRSPFAVGAVAVCFGPCIAGLAFNLAAIFQATSTAHPAIRNQALYKQLALATVAGNIVGGNVAALGLVLGVAAIVRSVAANARLFHTAIPLAFAANCLFWFLARNSPLSRLDAGFLLGAAAVALALLVRAARKESDAVKAEFAGWVPEQTRVWLAVLLSLAGVTATLGGAVLAASKLIDATRALKTSMPVMGLTLAAFGTSLPALVAAVAATRRGRPDLVLGVVVGAVVFNLLLVTGIVAMVEPLPITPHAIYNEIPAMAVFALLLLPVLLNGLKVPRWEGALLLAGYAGFVAWQVLRVPR